MCAFAKASAHRRHAATADLQRGQADVTQSTTRRDFIRTVGAGAVAAAGTIAPAAATARPMAAPAKSRVLGANDRINVGFVGCGGRMNSHITHVMSRNKAKGDVQAIAVNDIWETRKKLAQEKTGVEASAVYHDYRELVQRPDIDAVVISSPDHWHYAHAMAALEAGKDVYLEKPMTLNLPDAIALAEVAKAHPKVIVQVGTQQTRMPKFHAAKKLIEDGAIGVPTFSQTSYCRNSSKHNPPGEWHYSIDKNWKPGENLDWNLWCKPLGETLTWDPKVYYQWRRYRKVSTGIIGDLLVHVMTPMMMAINQGWPVRVAATGSHLIDKAMENHDNINLVVQFETGHQMFVCGSTCNNSGVETMIRGHKANIFLGGRNCEVRPESPYSEELEPMKVECPDIGDDQDAHRVGFLSSMRTRQAPDSGVELGLKVMVVVDLATRSMWEGGAFTFDPKTMKTTRA